MKLRRCGAEDFAVWSQLNREFMVCEIGDNPFWNETEQVSDEVFYGTFCDALARPELIVLFLIEEDGIAVGFLNVMFIFSVWSYGKAAVLDDLYIRPDYQGRGFGRKVMEELELFAVKCGCKRLQFQSEVTNPGALAFYTSLGYEKTDMYFYAKYF